MIRKNKFNENYVLIDYVDILIGTSIASKQENQEMVEKLTNLFVSDNEEKTIEINGRKYKKDDINLNAARIKKDSDVVKFLKEQAGVIDYETYIDKDTLKDAFIRSYYEFNHEMKNLLSYYLRKYIDNEIKGIDNEYIRADIVNNKPLLEYIKRYDDFTSYVDEKIEQNIDMKEKINVITK